MTTRQTINPMALKCFLTLSFYRKSTRCKDLQIRVKLKEWWASNYFSSCNLEQLKNIGSLRQGHTYTHTHTHTHTHMPVLVHTRIPISQTKEKLGMHWLSQPDIKMPTYKMYRILLANSCGYYKFQVSIGAVTNWDLNIEIAVKA